MNWFLLFADMLMVVTFASVIGILWGSAIRRVVMAQLTTLLAAVVLLLLSFAFEQPSFADLAIVLVFLSVGGSLAYAHVFERWL